MSRDETRFMLWALAIVGAATGVILYQHSVHSGLIMNALGAPGGASPQVGGTISANPINSGAASTATGQWTPLGPASGVGAFPYNPGQSWQ